MGRISTKRIREISELAIKTYEEQKAASAKARYDTYKERTRQILNNYRAMVERNEDTSHIDTMLDVYKDYCDRSHKIEDARRYRVLFWRYIASEQKTVYEIADGEIMDFRSVYRDVDEAVDILAILLFGIDALPLS